MTSLMPTLYYQFMNMIDYRPHCLAFAPVRIQSVVKLAWEVLPRYLASLAEACGIARASAALERSPAPAMAEDMLRLEVEYCSRS